jgi:hypothetical protein
MMTWLIAQLVCLWVFVELCSRAQVQPREGE